ncbi:MAG: CsbD family protein [Cyanobacteriota bacterium]|nr:CsbD family protein [Cyanobacteriota bacterium]
MKTSNSKMSIERAIKRFRGMLHCLLAAAIIWVGTSIPLMSYTQAEALQISPQLMTVDSVENAIEELDEKVKSELDEAAGAGTSDRLEGKVDRVSGKVKRDIGRVSGETEGALQQARGKAKEDIGRTKNAIDDAADEVQESSEGFFSGIKNFFD